MAESLPQYCSTCTWHGFYQFDAPIYEYLFLFSSDIRFLDVLRFQHSNAVSYFSFCAYVAVTVGRNLELWSSVEVQQVGYFRAINSQNIDDDLIEYREFLSYQSREGKPIAWGNGRGKNRLTKKVSRSVIIVPRVVLEAYHRCSSSQRDNIPLSKVCPCNMEVTWNRPRLQSHQVYSDTWEDWRLPRWQMGIVGRVRFA